MNTANYYPISLFQLAEIGVFASKLAIERENDSTAEIIRYLYNELVDGCTQNRFGKRGKLFSFTQSYGKLIISTCWIHNCRHVKCFHISNEDYLELKAMILTLSDNYPFTFDESDYRFSKDKGFFIGWKSQ